MNREHEEILYRTATRALAALFVFLSLYKLDLVLAAIDETWITRETLLSVNGKSMLLRPAFFWPKLMLPNMTCFYTGVLPNLIELPFLRLFGLSYFSMRIGFILLSAAGLVSLNSFLRRWLGRWTALLVVFLAITDTMHLRALRRGSEHEELIVLNLFWIGLALLTKAGACRRVFGTESIRDRLRVYAYLAGAGFVWGIAVWGKLHTCVYIAAAAAAWLLFFRNCEPLLRGAREKCAFCFAFLAGILPLINFLHKVKDPIYTGFASRIHPEYITRTVPETILIRLGHLWVLLREKVFEEWIDIPNAVTPAFALTAIVLLLVFALTPKAVRAPALSAKLARSLILVYASAFAAILFAPQSPTTAHILVLLFLVPLAAGIIVNAAAIGRRPLHAAFCAVLALTFAPAFAQRGAVIKRYFVELDKAADYRHWALSTTGSMHTHARGAPVLVSCAHMLAAKWMGQTVPIDNCMGGTFKGAVSISPPFYLITDSPLKEKPAPPPIVRRKIYENGYKKNEFIMYKIDHKSAASTTGYLLFRPDGNWNTRENRQTAA